MILKSFFLAAAIIFVFAASNSYASGNYHAEHKSAVVLAMFGTSVESALKSLINIKTKIEIKFPNSEVRMAFTSNIIRKKWQNRANDPEYIKTHPDIPKDILHVKTPLATIADLQNEGFDSIVIQPTHVSMGEEFLDLKTYVKGLMEMGTFKKPKYKPFYKIALGRPALGTHGLKFPYTKDIATLAKALAPDAKLAKKEKAGIVYMGHGNKYFPGNGGSYLEFASVMRKTYPGVVTTIGNVEGFPGIEDVMESLNLYGIKKVVLKPFMVVAGDHSVNDMASDEEDSWKTIFEKNGFKVVIAIQGLGENNDVANIFVNHAMDAAENKGIQLK